VIGPTHADELRSCFANCDDFDADGWHAVAKHFQRGLISGHRPTLASIIAVGSLQGHDRHAQSAQGNGESATDIAAHPNGRLSSMGLGKRAAALHSRRRPPLRDEYILEPRVNKGSHSQSAWRGLS
jgi:hypothetical protein